MKIVNRKLKIISIVGILLALIILGWVIFYFNFSNTNTKSEDTIAENPASFSEVTKSKTGREVPSGFKEYKTNRFKFSILYPEDLNLKEIGEKGVGATFTFTHPKEERGFQIFVVPYTEAQVSEEQFKKDLPSGIRADLQNITVDGAVGASFHSTDMKLGETFEIWFVKNGFLYEVTTLKALSGWLQEIMKTWLFLS